MCVQLVRCQIKFQQIRSAPSEVDISILYSYFSMRVLLLSHNSYNHEIAVICCCLLHICSVIA